MITINPCHNKCYSDDHAAPTRARASVTFPRWNFSRSGHLRYPLKPLIYHCDNCREATSAKSRQPRKLPRRGPKNHHGGRWRTRVFEVENRVVGTGGSRSKHSKTAWNRTGNQGVEYPSGARATHARMTRVRTRTHVRESPISSAPSLLPL